MYFCQTIKTRTKTILYNRILQYTNILQMFYCFIFDFLWNIWIFDNLICQKFFIRVIISHFLKLFNDCFGYDEMGFISFIINHLPQCSTHNICIIFC
ncbi:hypothetical protein [Moraxella lacunata]|uniref:hypothetical protein n=1 Tax=Moraxella lacunata TaxID=477 RepID=UPI003EE125C1